MGRRDQVRAYSKSSSHVGNDSLDIRLAQLRPRATESGFLARLLILFGKSHSILSWIEYDNHSMVK